MQFNVAFVQFFFDQRKTNTTLVLRTSFYYVATTDMFRPLMWPSAGGKCQNTKYIQCKKQIYLYYCTYHPDGGHMRGRNVSVLAK